VSKHYQRIIRCYAYSSLSRGAIPRQLALEVLDSLQSILFPLQDKKSRRLLATLVRGKKTSFDPDVLNFEFSSIRNSNEKTIAYHYLADRLSALQAELDDPEPTSWIERLLQRRSKERHMMAATLIGVLIALLLGFASLAVSAYQAYISYQAWQHPVSLSP
jgi:hypothetical protein